LPRLTLIKLVDYREWTESLGHDREWRIQLTQSKIYNLLQQLFSKKDGFVIPIRYDYFIALSNGIDRETHKKILLEAEAVSPRGVRLVSIVHRKPFSAQLVATRMLENTTEKLVFLDGKEDANTVAHVDFNDISSLTMETSVFETHMKIQRIYGEITYMAARLGGITGYLGGDNMIAVIPSENLDAFLANIPSYLKVGVGVAYKPRKAFELAAEALTVIRRDRKRRFLIHSSRD
jgi:GTP cyclohydrolase IIa